MSRSENTTTTSLCSLRTCDIPTQNVICQEHVTELVQLLKGAGDSLDSLRVAFTRQGRFTRPNGAASTGETAVPWDDQARRALSTYVSALARWQAAVADQLGSPLRYPNAFQAAAWLAQQVETNRLHTYESLTLMLEQLRCEEANARRNMDRPEPGWYAGQCGARVGPKAIECTRALYARSDTGSVKCPMCGTRWDVKERRQVLLATAETYVLTASEAARAVTVWSDIDAGHASLVDRIRKWRDRGRLQPKGQIRDTQGIDRDVYLMADILDLLVGDTRRSASA